MRRFLVFLLAALCGAAALAGEWGARGISKRFVPRGSKVFAADGRGVAVYDVSRSPVGRDAVVETGAESLDLTFLNDHEIAVATRAGIERYDLNLNRIARYPDAVSMLASNGRSVAAVTSDGIAIWNNTEFVFARRFPLMQPASAIAWHGDTLIAAVPGIGLYFFGGDEPLLVPENPRDIALAGDTLYVAAGVIGIATYDLRGSAPSLTSRIEAGERNFARIAASGQRIFVTESPDTVSVYDVTSAPPALVTRFKEPALAIAADGTRLFVSGTLFDQFGLPTETGAPIRIFDDARFVADYRDLAGPVSGVATDGTLAYIVDRPYFRVIDVSKTDSPREIASLLIENIGDRVKVRGNQALLFSRGDVQLIDISNPYAPRLVNTYHAQGGPPSTAAFGRNTILEGNPYSGFHVVDFIHFAEPRQIGGIKGHYFDIGADGGDIAYVNLQSTDLLTVDVTDQNNPHALNNVTIGPVLGEIVPATEHHADLLVVLTLSGIRIYNLTEPRSPVEMSLTPATTTTIAADGDVAYLAATGILQTLDLTNPSRPSVATSDIKPFAPMQIAAAKGKLVIADRYSLR
ncbi:MAG: hypothetical protein M3041_08180, partial [Acidobacteriota bacterium]|nr:hypothetical protein [Acidobacteriota bacterium]